MAKMTDRGRELIVRHEACPSKPYWAGGSSGITLGIGYDLAHHSIRELEEDWIVPGFLAGTGQELARLRSTVGVSGDAARILESGVKGIIVTKAGARKVFEEKSLPKYEERTRAAFPGVDYLPDEVYSALVSLIFNRGGDMGTEGTPSWDRRLEMREIRDAVGAMDVEAIAAALRRMKRHWEGKGLNGLLARRDDEAELVEAALA